MTRFFQLRLLTLLAAAGLLLGGCNSSKKTGDPAEPAFSVVLFAAASAIVGNPYFPLAPGSVHIYTADSEDGTETIVIEILERTRLVAGVECAVVRDRVYLGDLLLEDTEDWYAQDKDGNVWYMGEEVTNFEYDDDDNLIGTDNEGSWEAGIDGALPGIVMKATLIVGDKYAQENRPGEAEDRGEIVALDVRVTLSDGSSHLCLQTRDTNPLDPGTEEFKFYARGVGLVVEQKTDGSDRGELRGWFDPVASSVPNFGAATFSNPTTITNQYWPLRTETTRTFVNEGEDETEIIVIDVLDETRLVNGVLCVIVRDRVFIDDLLVEDTQDWYAQDDDGNVWYMGEEVVNFEHDDAGNVIATDDDGSWESGVEGAVPGIQMWANPTVGLAYHQEFWEDEAEDQAYVAALGVTVAGQDGVVYNNCVQILEWNRFEPESVEFKFYAPGLGVVRERKLPFDNNTPIDVIGEFVTNDSSLADFDAAVFTNPTNLSNPYFPHAFGTTYTVEKDTEDGLEVIMIEVEAATRVVNGVECLVVRDRVFVDGLLIEDTEDWYAQDDSGRVWYMGEDSTEFEYDDDDNLIATDDGGSWESGVDGAVPGVQMWETPIVGMSYYQEFYEDEAEDMAIVVATGVTVTADGVEYQNCYKILEWTSLEPGALEYKYFAPGIGIVLEESLTGEEPAERISD